jgi:hypothetical protein
MRFSNLNRGEIIAVIGGALLAVSVFLAWYKTGNANSSLSGCTHPGHTAGLHCSAWDSLSVLRYLLLLAAIAPAILAYIILREHALSWPRGELTAVVALTALTLVLVRGVIIKPGSPSGEIHLDYGWYIALLSGVLILAGAVTRTQESGRVRKPPGVL